MSLNFKYIPLTFLNDVNIIKEQIKNTVILRYLFDEYGSYSKLENLITGTQYGYNASALQSGKNKFLRISDITDGKVDWDTVPFCDCSDEDTYLLNKNDLLIARTGGTTGKSFKIDNPPEKAIFAGYLIRIRANKENNPDFLNLFLNSYVYWSQVVSLNKGEFRPSVNATKLKDLIVPKIDIEIQKDAVEISKGFPVDGYRELENNIKKALDDFEKSQEIIEHWKRQGNSVELLKQSILQEAIQGKLTADWREQNQNTEPATELLKRIKAEKDQLIKNKKIKKEKVLPPIKAEDIPFELPEGWVWSRLGVINNIFLGGAAFSSSRFIAYSNIQVIRISTFKNPVYIDEKNANENLRNELFGGDILITMTGTREKRDYCFTVELTRNHFENKRLFLNQRVGCFRINENINTTYTSLALKSQSLLEPVFESSTGSANQANISKDALLNILFPLPPFDEQKAIVEKVETLMQKCQALEQEIKNSEAHAQMLMQSVLKEAFQWSGKGEKEIVELLR